MGYGAFSPTRSSFTMGLRRSEISFAECLIKYAALDTALEPQLDCLLEAVSRIKYGFALRRNANERTRCDPPSRGVATDKCLKVNIKRD
jgi:hypothetical protein